jgi:hypothetical protein
MDFQKIYGWPQDPGMAGLKIRGWAFRPTGENKPFVAYKPPLAGMSGAFKKILRKEYGF